MWHDAPRRDVTTRSVVPHLRVGIHDRSEAAAEDEEGIGCCGLFVPREAKWNLHVSPPAAAIAAPILRAAFGDTGPPISAGSPQ
jgi:hypothetical protein